MIIGIVGSRGFNDMTLVRNKILDMVSEKPKIISGGAYGVDKYAITLSRIAGLETEEILPDFSNGYDVRQYHYRNDKIIERSDMIIAFWDKQSRGTKSIIDKCRKLGKRIDVITS